MARIEVIGPDFNVENAVQSDFSTIEYYVRDTFQGTETASGTLNVSDVIYNTLQTGDVWTEDSEGFNFAHRIPADGIPDGNKTYVAEYRLESTTGDITIIQFSVQTKKSYS